MKRSKQTWQKRFLSEADLCPRCQRDCLRYATERHHTKQKNMQMTQLKPLTFPSCTVCHQHCHNLVPFLVWNSNRQESLIAKAERAWRMHITVLRALQPHNTSIAPVGGSIWASEFTAVIWMPCDPTPVQWWDGTPLLPGDRLMRLHARI